MDNRSATALPYPSQRLGASEGEGLVKLFGRHFLTMVLGFRDKQGKVHTAAYSAFVASHDGEWSLLTAGHNLAQIAEMSQSAGIVAWDLGDAFAERPHEGSTPSGLRMSDWKYVFEELNPSGTDIAAATLSPFIVRSLKANNVIPLELADDVERLAHLPCHNLFLVGCARETTHFQGTRLMQLLYCIPVSPLNASDVAPALRGEAPRVHGSIQGDGWSSAGITTIEGTSGGPLFGVWFSDDKSTFDYAAVGIQSGWDKPSKQIAAWPLGGLSKRLADLKRRA